MIFCVRVAKLCDAGSTSTPGTFCNVGEAETYERSWTSAGCWANRSGCRANAPAQVSVQKK
jgi:hypothetical protein